MSELLNRQIIAYHYNKGYKNAKKLANVTGLSIHLVYAVIRRIKNGMGIQRRPGSARKRKLTGPDLRSVTQITRHNPHISSRAVASRLRRERGIAVSHVTVCTSLRRVGITKKRPRRVPAITARQKAARVTRCREMLEIDFSRVLITDESIFQLQGNNVKVWSRSVPKKEFSKFPIKVMVWGAMSQRGRLPLIFCEGNVNSERYCNIIDAITDDADVLYPDGWSLQQDNARPHTSAFTRRWLHNRDIDVVAWPVASPDLSPIENVWWLMKREVEAAVPRTLQELQIAVQEAWEVVNDLHCEKLMSTIKDRFRKCIQLEGECISRGATA